MTDMNDTLNITDMTELCLPGCRPEPMMSYLKALGILRLVAAQADHNALGYWKDDIFCLASRSMLDDSALVNFFLDHYSPTPIVTPWNGGSGFFEGDRSDGLFAILQSTAPRFKDYRDTIQEILQWREIPQHNQPLKELKSIVTELADRSKGKKQKDMLTLLKNTDEGFAAIAGLLGVDPWDLSFQQLKDQTDTLKKGTKQKEIPKASINTMVSTTVSAMVGATVNSAKKLRTEATKIIRGNYKDQLILLCRNRLNDRVVEWIDAAVVIGLDGQPAYLPMLGTGGNEGRLDYGNTFMYALRHIFFSELPPENVEELLRNALFGARTNRFIVAPVGQHDPGRAGGFNQGAEIETKDFPSNPWDFILSMEGTIAWAGNISRRNTRADRSLGRGKAASPFTVNSRSVGYESSTEKDKDASKAEIWTPLWKRPVSYRELRQFLGEGRADINRQSRQPVHGRQRSARDTIEFAEAVTSLGVDRGVSEFVRYSLIERRGKSFITLPAGRFPVHARHESDLIRQIHPILDQLDSFLRQFKSVPSSMATARRQIDASIYEVLQRGGAVQVRDLVAAIGRMEKLISQRDTNLKPKLKSPLQGLAPAWLSAADDGSLEVRIAAALASIGRTGKVGPVRANLEPVDPGNPWVWGKASLQTAWIGESFPARMASVLLRRMMDAERLEVNKNPTYGAIKLQAEDIAAFIDLSTNDHLIEDLLFGFLWLKWNDDTWPQVRQELRIRWSEPVAPLPVPREFALLKLLFLPGPISHNKPSSSGNVSNMSNIHNMRKEAIRIRPERSLIPLLRANRVADACQIAQRRLFASGLNPVRCSYPGHLPGTRLAAALLLPIRNDDALQKKVLHHSIAQ